MLLKYFYDPALAHASYLVGCQRTNEALVVDPSRDITPYLDQARQEGMTITAVAETHIHADFVSGARELAAHTGATMYLSNEGGEEWLYEVDDVGGVVLLSDGDKFALGNVGLEVMHTPGHTPESLSFLLTDHGGGAEAPMGIFTGDFVFVGAVGRPDLLERAVGTEGSAEQSARQMFHALKRFKALPPYLQVWPAHGAGSACGKGLGAVPTSTVGYEVRFNPGLHYEEEDDFVEYLLADQPEVPPYFKEMKRVNKEGPALVYGEALADKLSVGDLEAKISEGATVVDVRPHGAFAAAHVKGTLNIALGQLATWGGWLLPYDAPYYLIVDESGLDRATRLLREIGADTLGGYFDAAEVAEAGLNEGSYQIAGVEEMAESILKGEVTLIDVRAETEWAEGHLPTARHHFLGTLHENADDFVRDNGKPVVVQCLSGARSSVGASILKAAGVDEVINLKGGYQAWSSSGLPVEKGE